MSTSIVRLGLKKCAVAVVVTLALVAGGYTVAHAGNDADAPEASSASTAAIATQKMESRYVSVTPCRLVDTRPGTPIQSLQIREFDAVGTNLSAQGGSATGCGIPDRADSISVNITAVDPVGTGFLRAGAACWDSFVVAGRCTPTVPSATAVNYSTALNASNGVDVPLCTDYPTSAGLVLLLGACQSGFNIGAFTKATDVVVDVTGYYARPIFAFVDGDETVSGGSAEVVRSSGVAAVSHTGIGVYTLDPVDDIRGCMITTGNTSSTDGQVPYADVIVSATVQADSDIVVTLQDADGAPTNSEFTVVVEC